MPSQSTQGIKVTVISRYSAEVSKPSQSKYVHQYNVTIENYSGRTVQLMAREWYIIDSKGEIREVKGEGVIGAQPILEDEESYTYNSWCPLKTSMGKMYGYYHMVDVDTAEDIKVEIPEFKLIADFVYN